MSPIDAENKLNLGFDIDGVITDFSQPLLEAVRRNYGLNLKVSDIYCFDLHVVLGITHSEEEQVIVEAVKEDLPLNIGAKETLERLSLEGNYIYLLTSRYSHLRDLTESWLKEKNIPYNQLHFLHNGKKYLAEIDQLDLVVEDSVQEALGWSQKVEKILIYDQPWNKTLNVRKLTKRVFNWNQIYDEICKLKIERRASHF